MSWNGHPVIDMDSHIVERAEEFFRDHIDPAYREMYEALVAAVQRNKERGMGTALFGNRYAVVESVETGRPLGVRDAFAPVQQRGAQIRTIKDAGSKTAEKASVIRPEVSWDVNARLVDMDRAMIDVNVLFATHVTSYCAFRDVGFESAMYRAYHRWVADFCAQAPDRLKWAVIPNMRDIPTGVKEIEYWAERDPNVIGVCLSPRGSGGKLLDSPDYYPIYDAAQNLDLPLLVHPGTARPPYGPGMADLDGSWFLLQSLNNCWAGMTALGALIGGGIFDVFPKLNAAVVETSGGWMPLVVERFDANFHTSPAHTPFLQRTPSEVITSGRYAHAIDTWEGTLDFLVESLGEDLWLFSTDFPHKGTQWPNGVQQVVDRPGLSARAKAKILGGNALRIAPRLRSAAATSPPDRQTVPI